MEEQFQSLLAAAPYATIIVDEQGRITLTNSLAEELFGYGPQEMLGRPVEILIPERLRDQHRQCRAAYMLAPRVRPVGTAGRDLYGRRRDGSEFPADIGLSPLSTDEGLFIVVAIRDMSRRQAEEEKLRRSQEQLRELSARLLSMREEERTRIARVIHDQLGQALTGLKMDVVWLQRHLDPDQPALLDKTRAMSALIDATVESVRRISTELRPGILDELGLVAALEWQLQEFQTRTRIQCNLVCPLEEVTLDVEGRTTVFRIFQETLTNVARHARATQVEAILEETDEYLILRVQDNGRGITDREINDPRSIGLLGMQERALLRGGRVQIQGAAGQGTTITIWLPLEKA